MRTTLHTLHTPAPVAFLRAVGDAMHRLRRELQQWRRTRRNYAALAALDDRMLRDLGVGRSEILSIAANPGDPHRARVMHAIHTNGIGTP